MKISREKKRALAVTVAMVLLLITLSIFWIYVYNPWAERQRRPLHYSEEIYAVAGEYSLDPYLVTALVFCESSFRADVVSKADAVGLMQVTPPTGEWIAQSIGMDDYRSELLTDPTTNLRLGCWYLDFLLKRYNGQVAEALTAYIAGQGDVDRWLKDPAFSEDGTTLILDNLTGPNTRAYARKILGFKEDYMRIYPDVYTKPVE